MVGELRSYASDVVTPRNATTGLCIHILHTLANQIRQQSMSLAQGRQPVRSDALF